MKAINIRSSFSNREKMRRNPFSLRNCRSISLRRLYISRSYSQALMRLLLGGTTGMKFGSSRNRVSDFRGTTCLEAALLLGFRDFVGPSKSGMIFGCLLRRSERVCWTRTGLRASVRRNHCSVCLVIRSHASFGSCGAQKNGLRHVWPSPRELVRPEKATGARPGERKLPDLPGVRASARVLPKLPGGENGRAGVSRRQPVLYQALRFLCGTALCEGDGQGCCQGTAP